MTIQPHARQFLIGPGPRSMAPGWQSRPLADGLSLSSCPQLPLAERPEGLILGLAADTEAGDGGPETWAGRWVLVDGRRLRLDAAGTLGCFYRRTPSGWWTSSSPEILRLIEPELEPAPDILVRGRGMSWFPPPASGIAGVRRLLPSQVLDLSTGELSPRRLLTDVPPPAYDAVLERLQRRLVAAMRSVQAQRADPWVALTGGKDSRVILAAAAAAGVRVTTYTFDDEGMAPQDRQLPPRLAAAVGYEHRLIVLAPFDVERARMFDQHAAGHCVDAPRDQVARQGWDQLPEGVTALGGLCFEVARCFYHRRLPADVRDARAQVEAIEAMLPSGRPEGSRGWVAWAGAHVEPGMDWRDRFYLEQRLAGWASSNAQGIDSTGRELVHLASCQALISDLLAIPRELRCRGQHQRDLVAAMAPELARFPTTPPQGPRPAARAELGRVR